MLPRRIELFFFEVVVDFFGFFEEFFVGGVVHEGVYDFAEQVGVHIDVLDQFEEFLMGEETLFEALVEEFVVTVHNLINTLDLTQLLLKRLEIRLQHLIKHIVDVVLIELQLSMPQGVALH